MIEFILECITLAAQVAIGFSCCFVIFFVTLIALSFVAKIWNYYKQAVEAKE